MVRTGLCGLAGNRKQYVSREHLVTAEDLVNRNFTAMALNQLWCTGITEPVPVKPGQDSALRRSTMRRLSNSNLMSAQVIVIDPSLEGRLNPYLARRAEGR